MIEGQESQATAEGKVESLEKIDTSWNALLDVLNGIPADRLNDPVCGEWSVKDLVAHIAFWDGQAEIEAQRDALGESSPETDWQAMNEREAAASKDRPYDEVWRELNDTHERMRSVFRQLPALDVKSVGGDTFDHYDEHRAEIASWRERNGI
ncbi:MAG: maleylpyruvate isomerase N-terminal domain-containing protein [Thermomicrobiales bacterium]